jgi:hypothetical protein
MHRSRGISILLYRIEFIINSSLQIQMNSHNKYICNFDDGYNIGVYERRKVYHWNLKSEYVNDFLYYRTFRNKVIDIFWLPDEPILGLVHKHRNKITLIINYTNRKMIDRTVDVDYMVNLIREKMHKTKNTNHSSTLLNILYNLIAHEML